MKGGLGRGPQATPLEVDGEESRRDPPPLPLSPHSPPSGPTDAGDGPRGRRPSTPPEAGGKSIRPPKGPRRPGWDAAEALRHAPPRPHPPAPTGAATGKRTRASAQGRHTDHARDQHANTNQSSMEATPSMN